MNMNNQLATTLGRELTEVGQTKAVTPQQKVFSSKNKSLSEKHLHDFDNLNLSPLPPSKQLKLKSEDEFLEMLPTEADYYLPTRQTRKLTYKVKEPVLGRDKSNFSKVGFVTPQDEVPKPKEEFVSEKEQDRQNRPHYENKSKVKIPGSKKGARGPKTDIPAEFLPPPVTSIIEVPVIKDVKVETGSARKPFDNITVERRISYVSHYFQKTSFLAMVFLAFKMTKNFTIKKFLAVSLLMLFQYVIKFLSLRTKAELQLTYVNHHSDIQQRHEQNRLTPMVDTEFVFMKYDVQYKGPLAWIYDKIPTSIRFYLDDWSEYFNESTWTPKVEHYSTELLQSVLKPKIISGHGDEKTTLHQVEREITNRSDASLSTLEITDQNTVMSTTTIAKYIVKDAYRKTAELGFRHTSTNHDTNKVIESSIYQPSGGYLDPGNPKPISDSLSARVFLRDLAAVMLSGAVLAFISAGLSIRSLIWRTLWDALPEKLRDQLLEYRSLLVAYKLFIRVTDTISFMAVGNPVWFQLFQLPSDSLMQEASRATHS